MTWTTQLVEQERQALNLKWTQGDAVSFALRFVGLASYASYTWQAQLRCSQSRKAPLIATFLVGVTVDDLDLVVTMALTPSENQVAYGALCWDLQSDNGTGDIRTWIGGFAHVVADVTEGA